ncbi:hypothetical protein CMI42_01480 [Candidatus Pacearchaeota archaeon]|nr:hypothetical protein [Candidatus Pacearchaeota archaeon]
MGEVENIINEISPYYKRNKGPSIKHTLVYDSPSEQLEPLYFWILNFMGNVMKKREKLVDNFASSPGSGHFSELGLKKSQMQQQANQLMQTLNTVLRSVLNLIYDLKEFKIRLGQYDLAKSKDKAKSEAGLLALKQIWIDKVDIQRGQGSINALSSGNLQFVTLRDAFFTVKDAADVDKIDLNERVKKLLKPRIEEFLDWRKRSEMELRKRYEIEKTYLKSQVDSLKLQSRWAKPYLKAAEKLAQDEKLAEDEALVTAFNTVILQLTLMGMSPVGVESAASHQKLSQPLLPEEFKKISKKIRKFYSVVVIDFKFTGIPTKSGQNFVHGGRAEIQFKSYGLNEDEYNLLKNGLDDSDLYSALKLVQGMTEDSLSSLELDLEEFLEEKKEEKKKPSDNPFAALFNLFPNKDSKKDKKKEEEKLKKMKTRGIKRDSYSESFVRNLAIADAMDIGFKIYDTLKKAYGMASVPYAGEKGEERNIAKAPQTTIEKTFGF